MRERNHTMNTTRNQLYSISKAWEGGGGGRELGTTVAKPLADDKKVLTIVQRIFTLFEKLFQRQTPVS